MARATHSQRVDASGGWIGFLVNAFWSTVETPARGPDWRPPAAFICGNLERGLITVGLLRLILTILRLEGPQTTDYISKRMRAYGPVPEPLLGRLLRSLKCAGAIECERRARNEAAWWRLPGQELPERQPTVRTSHQRHSQPKKERRVGSWWAGASQAGFTSTAQQRWKDN